MYMNYGYFVSEKSLKANLGIHVDEEIIVTGVYDKPGTYPKSVCVQGCSSVLDGENVELGHMYFQNVKNINVLKTTHRNSIITAKGNVVSYHDGGYGITNTEITSILASK